MKRNISSFAFPCLCPVLANCEFLSKCSKFNKVCIEKQQQNLKENLFPVIEEKHFQHFHSFKWSSRKTYLLKIKLKIKTFQFNWVILGCMQLIFHCNFLLRLSDLTIDYHRNSISLRFQIHCPCWMNTLGMWHEICNHPPRTWSFQLTLWLFFYIFLNSFPRNSSK